MTLMGANVTAGWICAGALVFALGVWIIVMAGEFRNAIGHPAAIIDDESGENPSLTSPLPAQVRRITGLRGLWSGRRFLPVQTRRKMRRGARAERPLARP